MKNTNMTSSRGNKVANQFILEDDEGNTFFQSYDTVIAKRSKTGEVTLDSKSWNFSKTTGVYRNQFLNEGIAETRKNIKNNTYLLKELNTCLLKDLNK